MPMQMKSAMTATLSADADVSRGCRQGDDGAICAGSASSAHQTYVTPRCKRLAI